MVTIALLCSAHILSQEVPPSPEENGGSSHDHPTFVGTVSDISQGKIWQTNSHFWCGYGDPRYIYISVYNIYNLYEYQICIYIYGQFGCESMICWGTVWNGVAGVWDLSGFSSFAGKWLQSGTCMDMQFRALNRIWPAINGRFSQL